jgi:exodeoxyribonuclease VII small subunit
MAKKNKDLSFEEQISRIEDIVSRLDEGDTPLDEMLALYEEGMQLAAGCRKKLEEAEQKIILTGKKFGGEETQGIA